MKFTDGAWLMQPGVHAAYPVQIVDVDSAADSVTLYAATRPIRNRGDTLTGPLLTITCSTPLPNVIRVRLVHLAGQSPRPPQFDLAAVESGHARISADGEHISLSSDRLSVHIDRTAPWRLEFRGDDRLLTASEARGMGIIDWDGVGHFMHEQLALGVGENVYGLGERFTSLIKNGQHVEIWNRDGGTGSEQAYKNIPFYLTNAGYGVFVNHPE